MALSDTAVVSIVGIVTSGLLGPAAAALWARRHQREDHVHERLLRRRDDLQAILDAAAEALAPGATHLRDLRSDRGDPKQVREWSSSVHLSYERLLLRLSEDDLAARRYREARQALEGLAGVMDADASSPDEIERAIDDFEQARSRFLAAARQALSELSRT